MSDSLWSHGLYNPWNSPGQKIGVGSLSLLQGILEGKKKKDMKDTGSDNDWKFYKIKVRYQTKDPRNSESNKQDECQKFTCRYHIQSVENQR